jgi:DnaJ-class molecular chaperone
MENYYEILDVDRDSNIDQINKAYKNKIINFKDQNDFSKKDLKKIKLLKTAKFILNDEELRDKYDEILSKKNFIDEKKKIEKKYNNHLIGQRVFSLLNVSK